MSCKNMSFEECELVILRLAMDNAEKKIKLKMNTPEVSKIINIVANFIKNKKLICYGGTAINNILPDKDKFYDEDIDIPDYDFFSTTPIEDAIELTDIYHNQGFEVEAKSGQHIGTYKVFVNFMPIADITFMDKNIFDDLIPKCIIKKDILYAPPNFLRMSMFTELSRPEGDVSRWEKVLKRLLLLNKYYPIAYKPCRHIHFQRKLVSNKKLTHIIYRTVLDFFIKNNAVFFGGYAVSLFSKYMDHKINDKQPDFDILSTKPAFLANKLKGLLENNNIKNVKVIKHEKIGELIGDHYEIKVDIDTIAFIYEPLSCHSYNKITEGNKTINIATIDTMLSFYLAFLYIKKPYYYYDTERIVCMCQYLFNVQQHNRLKQKGLLKRFSIDCIGKQQTLEEIKEEKSRMYEKLRKDKNNPLYKKYFFRYKPIDPDPINSYSNKLSLHEPLDEPLDKPLKKTKKTKRFIHKTRKSGFFNWFKY